MSALLAVSQNVPGFGNQPVWIHLIKVVAVFAFLVVMTLFAIVFERKVVGRMQNRIGPNRVGPVGCAPVARRRRQAGLQGRGHPGAG